MRRKVVEPQEQGSTTILYAALKTWDHTHDGRMLSRDIDYRVDTRMNINTSFLSEVNRVEKGLLSRPSYVWGRRPKSSLHGKLCSNWLESENPPIRKKSNCHYARAVA